MTERYAHIHNKTLKKAFMQYRDSLVNIDGERTPMLNDWIQNNITSQILPNGVCVLPLVKQQCPHANAYLTCANFRTNASYLDQHRTQLEKTNALIKEAKEKGWLRIAEMNESIKNHLEKIINSIKT